MNKENDIIHSSETILKVIDKLIEQKEYKLLRKFLKNNINSDKLKPKELNNMFQIDDYKFTKRKGKLSFERNYYKPVNAQRENEILDSIFASIKSQE